MEVNLLKEQNTSTEYLSGLEFQVCFPYRDQMDLIFLNIFLNYRIPLSTWKHSEKGLNLFLKRISLF